jgi:hypothetical protein
MNSTSRILKVSNVETDNEKIFDYYKNELGSIWNENHEADIKETQFTEDARN